MFTRIDTKLIQPKFLASCEELIKACKARGVEYWAISGYRDPKEQEALYAIGRTTELTRKPVTNAKPYTSAHNYGLAIDFALDKDQTKAGLQPSWEIKDYEVLAEEARKLGLMPGMDFKTFKEGPHVQVKLRHKFSELETILKKEGLGEIWKLYS